MNYTCKPILQKRGTYYTNRAAVHKMVHELKAQRSEFNAGKWVVELGKSIRRFVNGPGPRGIVPQQMKPANTWTFAAWPKQAHVKTFHDKGYLPGTADMLRITAAQHRRERRAARAW